MGCLPSSASKSKDATTAASSFRTTTVSNEKAPKVKQDEETEKPRKHREQYDYMEIIGRGSFGEVVRVRQRDTGLHYAMKINDLRKMDKLRTQERGSAGKSKGKGTSHDKSQSKDQPQQQEQDNKQRQLSLAEEHIMHKLRHPLIVRIHNNFRTSHHSYLVMEFVKGQTLAHRVEQGALPLEVARKFVAELVSCVEYIHSRGIVHRDLKPDNIMIGPSEHIKLMDFGIAFMVSEAHPNSKRMIGGDGFKAPEVIRQIPYSFSVDWWNIGVLLYLMLSGKHPYEVASSKFSLTSHNRDSMVLSSKVKFGPQFDPVAKDLIERLLVTEPSKRLGMDENGKSNAQTVKKHAFFQGVDFSELRKEGKKTVDESASSFPSDEKAQFKSVEEVLQRFNEQNPEKQLLQLGIY
eukprot:g67976.t1